MAQSVYSLPPVKHNPSKEEREKRLNELARPRELPKASPSPSAARGDSFAGWEADPTKSAASRWSVGIDDRNLKVPSLGKKTFKGFRSTFVDQGPRRYVDHPGPGQHRTLREFALWDDENDDQIKAKLNSKASQSLRSTAHGAAHFQNGEDIDVKRTAFTRTSLGFFQKTPSTRSLPSLSAEKKILLPSSFFSPGPGAYTQFSSFGAPSGPTRNRYLGTNPHNNIGIARQMEPHPEVVDVAVSIKPSSSKRTGAIAPQVPRR